jgi:hypothetical protein
MGAVLGEVMGSEEPKESFRTESALPQDQPTHSEDGVDLTLIRWMLSLTPAERLQVLQQHVRAIQKLREANPDL